MADKEFAPLSTACARALNDRIYEKRKTAALEIEKMVKRWITKFKSFVWILVGCNADTDPGSVLVSMRIQSRG